MSSFTNFISIEPLIKTNNWITRSHFEFYYNDDCTGEKVSVPYGFVFDGISTPRLLWIIFPSVEPKTIMAGALHDYLVREKIYGYHKTNWYFYKALRAIKVGRIKSCIYFIGVTIGTWIPYYIRPLIQNKK